ncbi:MAG: alkaline phosphatase family protein [Candidatus Acidiferrum sp.]|jgi:phospholipase C
MNFKKIASHTANGARMGLVSLALLQISLGAPMASAQTPDASNKTTSPIKHLIVIIGENRSFDHVFATYQPKRGEFVWNLLSAGIVNTDGKPGPNFRKAQQFAATDSTPDSFLLSPPKTEFAGNKLPTPLVGGPSGASYIPNACAAGTPESQCAASLAFAQESENGLASNYYPSLLIGGAGLPGATPDTRISNVTALPDGPFQLTNGKSFVYTDYAASPVHRFYQMWQQLNCSVEHADWENPSGCNAKLFSWVEVTVGAGTNGKTQPPLCSADQDALPCFSTNYLPNVPKADTTGEGSTALGFYNVQQGDVPYFKGLADTYSMSDNFHQSVNGGTGANHIMFGHGDAIWFSDGNGNPLPAPHNVEAGAGTLNSGVVDEVENPNPAIGTNNWYSQDGYGAGSFGSPSSGGGSYTDCSDPAQPGVAPILEYLRSLPRPIDPRCEAGHYYLLNNYNPGYFGNGANAYTDPGPANTVFTIPPSSTPSIGDDMLAHNISWKYYGDQWNNYSGAPSYTPQPRGFLNPNGLPGDPYQINYGPVGSLNPLGIPITAADEYCTICNPFQYDTSIMTNAAIRDAHIQDTANLYSDIAGGTLPAVSIVKPSGLVDGHPASSKLDLFEGFVKKIVDEVQASPYAKDTAIFITEDEGGGYYDSGYVQPLDFFGDGTRIIFLVVSPYSKGGHIAHNYADHVSILKFIERNWNLPPVTKRSRDNFPNPVTEWGNPYVPRNSPAISDLFELFDFDQLGGR